VVCNSNDTIGGVRLKMDKLVTCQTKDCENENIEILVIDCLDRVICGCCNLDITKIEDPKPTPKASK
jgi:hypothetical protein